MGVGSWESGERSWEMLCHLMGVGSWDNPNLRSLDSAPNSPLTIHPSPSNHHLLVLHNKRDQLFQRTIDHPHGFIDVFPAHLGGKSGRL